jgi:hypothetical protein
VSTHSPLSIYLALPESFADNLLETGALCEGEGHGWVAYMHSRMTAGSLCVRTAILPAPAPTSIVTSWVMCILAGGKRTGADYSAEATACREMYEETAGKLQRAFLPSNLAACGHFQTACCSVLL